MKDFRLMVIILFPMIFSCQKSENERIGTKNDIVQLRSAINAGVEKYSTRKDCMRGKGDYMSGISVGSSDVNFPTSLSIVDADEIKINYLASNQDSEDGVYLYLKANLHLPIILSNSLQQNSLTLKSGTYPFDYSENEFGTGTIKYE